MSFIITSLVLLGVAGWCACQQGQQDYEYTGVQRPPPAILMHKQALSHDGNFNYVFTAENGLKQGETISPDGTRTGGYEYVDPSGKTISVKYTAGKDGFRILEGDHVPKAYPQQQIVSQPRYQHSAQFAPQPKYQDYDDGSYQQPQQVSQYNSPPSTYQHRQAPSPQVYRAQDEGKYEGKSRSVDYDYKEDDQHKGPHNFGSGYAFEFQG